MAPKRAADYLSLLISSGPITMQQHNTTTTTNNKIRKYNILDIKYTTQKKKIRRLLRITI